MLLEGFLFKKWKACWLCLAPVVNRLVVVGVEARI